VNPGNAGAPETCWAVVPAGGSGQRFGAARPKQYLEVAGRAVIAHTLDRLCGYPRIRGVLVGIASDDAWWPVFSHPRLLGVAAAGAERAVTVRNLLRALRGHADPGDWVMVHDAVRPCVRHEDLDALMQAAGRCPDGALLALPIADTVKEAGADGRVARTVVRDGLWRAMTPQLFRIDALGEALDLALEEDREVTDEASAMEHAGRRPMLVRGHADNLKITLPADLELAELFLQRQAGGE